LDLIERIGVHFGKLYFHNHHATYKKCASGFLKELFFERDRDTRLELPACGKVR